MQCKFLCFYRRYKASVSDDLNLHSMTKLHVGLASLLTERQARREGGGAGGGQLAPGPKQVGAPNLRNILKLNKAPSDSGRIWNAVHRLLVLLFENNDVIGAPNKILPRVPRVLSAAQLKGVIKT